MKASPLPYWVRQLEEVVKLHATALEANCGMRVVLQVKPGGRLEQPIVTIFQGGKNETA